VIVVDESYAHAARLAPDSNCLRDLFKFSIALVAQQMHAIAQANGEIGMAVVSKSPAAQPKPLPFKARPASSVASTKRPSPRCAVNGWRRCPAH